MSVLPILPDGSSTVYRNAALALLTWTLAVAGSLAWNVTLQREKTFDLAKNEALANINKDFAFRRWATGHGGVYVPVDPKTNTYPNPYLEAPERDIQTPSGRQLTLMNPAYMVRQMQQDPNNLYGVKGRITSLKPLNPNNAPDEWETRVLQSFERGVREAAEPATLNGAPYLRAMRAFMTEKGCLKCHAHQGYKVGDVRGGVGAYVPMEPYLANERAGIRTLGISHTGIWLLGLAGIGFVAFRGVKRASERKAYTEALRQNEERYHQMFEVNQAIKLLVDPESGAIIDANQAASQFYGYPPEQLRHMKIGDINPLPPGEIAAEMALAVEEQRTYFNFKHRLASGEVRDVEVYSGPISEGGRTLLYSIIHDITERKQAQQALAKRTQDLARSNAELEQFAYVASHDLQEPLRMVASYTQLLARRYHDKLDQDANDFIAYAVDGANRMQRLINDLLAFSRVGTRGKPFEPTDCNTVLKDVLDNLQMSIEETQATVTYDELPTVMADESQLSQLFQNLIVNSIKFRSEQAPAIHISTQRLENEWQFSVRDNGIGIPPEFFERIFVIFQRLHARDDYPGTGIGLAVCKRIVERHGGRIWVASTPGQGSTFSFTLPVAHQEA